MANVNVNRNVSDVFYRYKMPRLIAKVEGKGNGIKTVIVNMVDIAKSLQRPPTYPTKYFGCELGAQTQFDLKNDRYIVNGSHEANKLQDLLDGFIKKFVLCSECENPETLLHVLPRKGNISLRCIACGHVTNVDMRHKLTTFILKNPPEVEETTQNSTATTTPGKKNKKSKNGKEKDLPNGNGDSNSVDVTQSADQKVQPSPTNEDDINWGEDTSDAAVQARMEALSGAARTMTINEDLERTEQERFNLFYSFVKQKKAIDELTGTEKEKEVVTEAERLDVKDKAPLVLVELLYDANILPQIKQYRTLFLRFTCGNTRAQRSLIGGFEQLVGTVHPEVLMPKVPHILKAFYDNDLLEEQCLLEWDKKPSKKFVKDKVSKEIHQKAAPFIKWLQEAEEESSGEEEEEDSDVEVVYDERAKSNDITKVPIASDVKPAAVEETAEIDIDAI